MRVHAWRPALTIASTLVLSPVALATDTDPVERATKFVEQFEAELKTVVADEHYTQEVVDPDGSVTERRRLESEVMLTWLRDDLTWLMIRRVQRVDGYPALDAGQTFASILESGRVSLSLRSLADENAKYNIGPIRRNFNEPTWPLRIFDPHVRSRFRFRTSRGEDGETIIRFSEHDRPTLIRGTNGRNVPVDGRAWVDSGGAIGQVYLHAKFDGITSETTVLLQRDPHLDIVVPVAMDERFAREVTVTGHATYDNFRRFDTSVRIVPPGGA